MPRVVLLVDDQENDLALIRRALQEAEPSTIVRTLPGGQEAIAYLSALLPYDDRGSYPLPAIVLLDIKMPIIDGFEVLRWIRNQPGFAKLPVVMLTASHEINLANRSYQMGATSFFTKPFDFCNPPELSRVVQHLVSKAHASLPSPTVTR